MPRSVPNFIAPSVVPGNNVIQGEKTLRKDALVSYLSGGFKEASIVTQVTNGAW